MKQKIALLGLSLLVLSTTSPGEVIASTTFDGRTANANTAEDLTWITNGVADPGTMSADQFEAGPINLFDATPDVQNRFVPGINTGNGNTSWVTTVRLTALPGTTVTVENITFDYVAISGAQVINVNRRSDFEVTLLDPSGTIVASGSISEVASGNNLDPVIAPVSIDLSQAVTLDQDGTYSLVLRGGDFLDQNETGNHTGIDNLSINGTIGGGSTLAITSVQFDPVSGFVTLIWDSSPNTTFTIALSEDLVDWSETLDTGISAGAGDTTTFEFDLNNLPNGIPARSFFRVELE